MASNAMIVAVVAGLAAGALSGVGAAFMMSQPTAPRVAGPDTEAAQHREDTGSRASVSSLEARLGKLEQGQAAFKDDLRELRAEMDRAMATASKVTDGGVSGAYVAALEKRLALLETQGAALSGAKADPATQAFKDAVKEEIAAYERAKDAARVQERRDRREQWLDAEYQRIRDRMANVLGLNDNQRQQVDEVTAWQRKQMLAIEFETIPQIGETEEQLAQRRREAMDRVSEEYNTKMRSVLDAGQYERFKDPAHDLDLSSPSYGRRVGFTRPGGPRRN